MINRINQNIDNKTSLQHLLACIEPAIAVQDTKQATQALNSISHYDKQVLAVKVQDSLGKPVLSWSQPSSLLHGPTATLTHKIRLTAQQEGIISITRLERQDSRAVNGMLLIQVTLFGALLTMTLLTVYYLNAFGAECASKIKSLIKKQYAAVTAENREPPEASFLCTLSQLSDEILQISAEVNKLHTIEHDLSVAKQSASGWQSCFELLANGSTNGIVIIDDAGRVKFINNTAAKLLEWNESDVYDKDFCNLVQGKVIENGNAELLESILFKRQCRNKEDIFWTKSKLPISVIYNLTTFVNHERQYASAIIFDNINPLRQLEQKIKISEDFKQEMLESSLDAVVMIDHLGLICEFNKNAEEMFGYKKDEVLGKEMAELVIPSQHREAHRKGLHTYLQSGEHNILRKRIELTALRATGKEFPIELVVAPIKLHDATLFIGFLIDITEKNKAKQAIIKAREEAENASKAKSQFLAAMSHEIRTPLNAIIGVNDLLQTTDLDTEQMEYVKVAQQAGISLQEVINNILDYSKVEAGKMNFNLQKTDIIGVVDSVLSIMGPKASEKKLDLFATIDYPIPEKTLIDPGKLRQILLNIVSNAIKFTDQGSVEIHVGLAESWSDVNTIVFSVIDTGIGISEDAKKIIFEEFSQADFSTTRKYGGTGLGLAIARRLVDIFGGDIGVESKEGKGSTFWFTVLCANREFYTPPPYPKVNSYLFNSVHASACALYKHLKILCENAVFLSSDQPIPSNCMDLCLLFIDERQISFFSEKDLDEIKILRSNNLVKVLIADIVSTHNSSLWAPYFDAFLTRPIQINHLNKLIKRVWEAHQRGEKIKPEVLKTIGVTASNGNEWRILLVEDSVNNQKVIGAMLTKMKYKLVIAENGQEALEKCKAQRFDLILMDISMPVMGGMETTEYLRRNEGINQKTPIIALTASAYEDKKNECLSIGMNGFLAKPLSMARLQEGIAKIFNIRKPDGGRAQTAIVNLSTTESTVIDYKVLGQLKIETSEQIFPELVAVFLKHGAKRVDNIELAVQQGDYAKLTSEVHALKGESATYGAIKLAELTKTIDSYCKEGLKDKAFSAAQGIRHEWVAVYEELQTKC